MRARTKLQAEVLRCSQYLINYEVKVLSFAKEECLENKGLATKNRVICMICGGRFSTELVSRKRAVCPHCSKIR